MKINCNDYHIYIGHFAFNVSLDTLSLSPSITTHYYTMLFPLILFRLCSTSTFLSCSRVPIIFQYEVKVRHESFRVRLEGPG